MYPIETIVFCFFFKGIMAVKQDLNMPSSETKIMSLNNYRFVDYLHLSYPKVCFLP